MVRRDSHNREGRRRRPRNERDRFSLSVDDGRSYMTDRLSLQAQICTLSRTDSLYLIMFLMLMGAFVLFLDWPVTESVFHTAPGPWVIASEGEIWPLPLHDIPQDGYFLLQSSNFQFKVLGESCDIVDDAIRRYTDILKSAEQTDRRVYDSSKRYTNYLFKFKGYLTGIDFRLIQPCEKYPHLLMNETYTLKIVESSNTATLTAETVWGLLRGLETFSQLWIPTGYNPSLVVKCRTIVDGPRLPHRGLLLDTSRHFLPLSDILLTMDAMSYNKLNVLHWHIVDDNSFPYQSMTYPELSVKGAYHSSMVYTPEDVKKVIEYGRLRGIRILPEFDSPGHTNSWGLAYPGLLTPCYGSNGKPDGTLGPMNPTDPLIYRFLRGLFSEITQVFPDQFVHLGGDEVPFECWASNPDILEYMRENGMAGNFSRLEEEYIRKLLDITSQFNASSIVWQEVFDNGVNLQPNVVVHVWTGHWQNEINLATRAGHPVLLSACWYLDHIAGGGDWKKFYNCDPLSFPGNSRQKKLMLGGEACMWGEFVDRNNVHQRIWPRASAAAERLWSTKTADYNSAAARLEEHACRMNRRGIPAQPPNGPGFCVL
ncbi:beta-hexosaminidase subunit beta-like [Orussus abietinus]|uniref:beta-hexosaminidase subunit beta-like n=1 Tax=Orussus abietinus TaxID=222816 RepID=UPI000625913A|nr:beta-hexosaminidase subunit beta-like [Orussus abietinus]